jgi:hypothetical protein
MGGVMGRVVETEPNCSFKLRKLQMPGGQGAFGNRGDSVLLKGLFWAVALFPTVCLRNYR